MFVVDTNVLVHTVDRASPWHVPCRDALGSWRSRTARWHLTWSIVHESLKTVTHRAAPRPLAFGQALAFVEGVLAAPGLRVLVETPAHASLLAELPPDLSGTAVHDAHIVVLMREHGVRLHTRDAGFRRYAVLEVVDPAPEAGTPGVAGRVARYRRRRRG